VSSAEVAIGRRALRQVAVGSVVWAVVFGATAASSALAYVSTFPDEASRQQIAATTSADAGLHILLGPVSAIDTVGGYTVYKCFVFLTTIGALWGLLAATRLLRGEEDAGRWTVVLAGATRAPRATAATMAALAVAVAVIVALSTAIVALAGLDPDVGFPIGESVVYGLSLAIGPAVFAALGAVTSQLARTRRLATGLGMAAFGLAFVVRMVADSGPSTRWLLWTTPFGWTERMRPFTGHDLRPLGLAATAVIVLTSAALALAARRDVGAGMLASRDVAPPRALGLGSAAGLAARLEAGVLVAWALGAAASAFVFGMISKIAVGPLPPSFGDTLEGFGVRGAFLDQYFSVAFLLAATVVALLPASQIGAAAEEETSGRLVHVLVQPTRRAALLGGRLALTAVGTIGAGASVGLAAWLGGRSQGVDVDLAALLGAGLNLVPTGLLVLGGGAVVLAVAPRVAARAMYGVVIWSLLVDLLGSMVASTSPLAHLSLFHYMALAPAESPQVVAVTVSLLVALMLCVGAVVLFARRDVATG
jgi:ABC-2 type transport system permease protein